MDRSIKIIFILSIIATAILLAFNWWIIKVYPASVIVLSIVGMMMFVITFLGIYILPNKEATKADKKFSYFMIAEGINGIVLINSFLISSAKINGILKADISPNIPIITMCSFIAFFIITWIGVKIIKNNNF